MKVSVYSTKPYDEAFLSEEAKHGTHELDFIETRLTADTAKLASGSDAVCVFVNDDVSKPVLGALADQGVRVVALRCAGFNNVDLEAAEQRQIQVVRVPGVFAVCGRGA